MKTKIAGCPLGAKCEEVKEENGEQVMYRCPWFKQVRGMDRNTGAEVDQSDCAISWIPMLLIENSQHQRETGAAVESFRNEVVKKANAGQLTRPLDYIDAQSNPLLNG